MSKSSTNVYSIPFNRPFLTGREVEYILDAVQSGKISGNGKYTVNCQKLLEKQYGFQKVLLTTSCTDALEMSALLAGISPGDEVILPSYTFVSTANAFALRGARLVFADCQETHPNLDPQHVESLITPRTKAVVLVHYAGVACEMGHFKKICNENKLYLIEDAAHALDSYYKGVPLGSIGNLGTFSFHETKNIISGEGGALLINDPEMIERAEILWEKGTNRSAFEQGKSSYYTWVDLGSSYLPSDVISAFLYAQLERIREIQDKRKSLWYLYQKGLQNLEQNDCLCLPYVPYYASVNGHMFYIVCKDTTLRQKLINYLKKKGILAIFHYIPLHSSPYAKQLGINVDLPNTDKFSGCLLRLPLFYSMKLEEIEYIIENINSFFKC